MSSSAAHKPEDLEARFQGQVRHADGYEFWTTSEEDEATIDFDPSNPPPKAKPKRKQLNINPAKIFKGVAKLVGLVVLGALIYFVVTFVQVYLAADNDDSRLADAIVVLGAAQFDGTPSPVFQERLDHAFTLWEREFADRIVTTGSKQEGDQVTEGIAGYNYLRERGVPDSALVPIVDGGNTYEQLTASSVQIDNLEISSVLLVSDGYHNYRLLDIADEVGIEAYVAPTDAESSFSEYFRESVAVSVGRITGYRRLSSFTQESTS